VTKPEGAPKPLVIYGNGSVAEVAYEYFTHDSDYEVLGFTVERSVREEDSKFGLPMIPFEEVEATFSPEVASMFVAVGYLQRNRVRSRIYETAKAKGYRLATYVSSRAFVWRNVQIGENCFILENNVLQPFLAIGNNVMMWSGNHVGHHSRVGDNCFISSHVVISGFVDVGPNCVFGVNSTVGNDLRIGAGSVIGAGAVVLKDVPPGSQVRAPLPEGPKPTETDSVKPTAP
jgi:sugar O-acyltransferase (sialic acid O-acetyltransferase NeuD family)